MARKTIKRSRKSYNKMDKRKRRTERKKRKGRKSKQVKKTQKGGMNFLGCGSKPNKRHRVWVVNGANPPDGYSTQTMQGHTEETGLTDYRMATIEEIRGYKASGYYVFPSQEIYNKYMNLKKRDNSLEKYKR